jgi:hypothetical protein
MTPDSMGLAASADWGDMDDHVHFARLESPSDAFRSSCGLWRDMVRWTTDRRAVTCPECARRIAQKQGRGSGHAAAIGAASISTMR